MMKTLSASLASAVITTSLLGVVHVLHAESPSFAPGETLSASKMNASFASLSARVDAIERAGGMNGMGQSAVPSGTIIAFGGPNVPEGWLSCDGSSLDRVAEPALFAAIGASWGALDATKFNLPDLRGIFLRGVSGASDRDPDREARAESAPGGNKGNLVGSTQGSELQSHSHTMAAGFGEDGPSGVYLSIGGQSFGTSAAGGSETRPKNANVLYIIKR